MRYVYAAVAILVFFLALATGARAATILFPIGGGTGWGAPGGLFAHSVLIGNGLDRISTTSPGTSGYVLTSNGPSDDPSFQPVSSSGGGSVATSSSEEAGYFPYWTSTAGNPATLSGTSSISQLDGKIGIGSTTPTEIFSLVGNSLVNGHTAIGNNARIDTANGAPGFDATHIPQLLVLNQNVTGDLSTRGEFGHNVDVGDYSTYTHTGTDPASIFGLDWEPLITPDSTGPFEAFEPLSLASYNQGSGDIGSFVGVVGSVFNLPSAGTTTDLFGLEGRAVQISGAVTSLADIFAAHGSIFGGTVGTSTGVYIDNQAGSLVDTNYGLFIKDQTGLGSLANYNFYSDAAKPTVITPEGNVGIGTTSPFQPLSVAGNAIVTGTTTSSCFTTNGVTCLISGSGTVGAGTAGQVPYYATDGTVLTATSSVFIAANSKVGIGSTTPLGTLTIDTNDALNLAGTPAIVLDDSREPTGQFFDIRYPSTSAVRFTPSLDGTFTHGPVFILSGDIGSPGGIFASAGTVDGSDVNFASTPTSTPGGALKIKHATGFVGIASTSPASLLSIGSTNGINFSTATSTFFSTGGINLANGGCYAINGSCLVSGANAITALTGDVTASGPGSAVTTLATVNGNVGTFGSSTAIPTFTVNAKGLVTAASTNAVIAPAGTLTGTALASNVVTSSLTSLGTLGSLTVSGQSTLGSASTTQLTVSGNEWLPSLASPTGSFIAVDTSGKIVSTTTPSFSLTGTTGQLGYFSGTNTFTATSTMFLTPIGNFGLGTTSPSQRLSVAGNALISGTTTSSNLALSNSGVISWNNGQATLTNVDDTLLLNAYYMNTVHDQAYNILTDNNDTGSAGDSRTIFDNLSGELGDIGFSGGNMRILNNMAGSNILITPTGTGKIGIASTTPNSLLSIGTGSTSVAVSTGGVLNIKGLAAPAGNFLAVNGNGDVIATTTPSGGLMGTTGQVAYFSGTNTAVGTSSMFIASNGNVGIGSTSPTTKLVVGNGTSGNLLTFDAGGGGSNFADINSTALTGIRMYGGTSYAAGPAFQIWPSGSSFQGMFFDAGASSGADIHFRTSSNAGVDALTILQGNGRVGVNDSSPDFRFETTGSNTNGYFGVTNSSDGDIFTINASGNVGIASSSPWGNLSITPNGGTPAIVVATSSRADFIVAANGFVGIGTSTPRVGLVIDNPLTSQLLINRTSTSVGTAYTSFGTGGLTKFGIGLDADETPGADKLTFYDIVAGVSTMTMFNGRLGIGTSTPISKLTVNGDIGTDGARPSITSCGTGPAITTGSTDTAGEITEGTVATGCTIGFTNTKAHVPFCTLSSESGLLFRFVTSTTGIVITNIGALSSTKVSYTCIQNNL